MNELLFSFTLPDELISMDDVSEDTFLSRDVIREQRRIKNMSIQAARALNHPEINAQIERLILNRRNKKMKKDGFTPGWQENIQAYAGGRLEYDRMLKERGLVEIGYDYVPQDSTTETGARGLEFALHAKELGIELSENEVEAIADGSYFDASKCDLSSDE